MPRRADEEPDFATRPVLWQIFTVPKSPYGTDRPNAALSFRAERKPCDVNVLKLENNDGQENRWVVGRGRGRRNRWLRASVDGSCSST
jgi:hypothetical protein